MGIETEGDVAAPRLCVLALVAVALMLVLGAVTSPPARASAPINVNTTNDETNSGDGTCSMREAILYADGNAESDCSTTAPAGTTTINLIPGLYVLSGGVLSITHNVVINGPGASITKIDAAGSSQLVSVGNAAQVSISGTTFTDGVTGFEPCGMLCFRPPRFGAPGGGIANAGTLVLNGVTVSGNRTSGGSVVTTFFCPNGGCSAGNGGDGGGISNTGTLTVANSTITDNATGAGGTGTPGVDGGSPGNPGGNGGSGGRGGGIYNTGTLTITNSTISSNMTGAGGNGSNGGNGGSGAAGGSAGSSAAAGSGAGIENFGSLTVTGSTIVGNKTGIGGGGANGGIGSAAPGGNGSTGSSGGSGGGIDSNTNMTVSNSTIVGNSTAGGGGGGAGGTGTFQGATGGPGQPGNGGGVNQSAMGATVTHVTIASNTAAGVGGGLSGEGGSITVANSIISSNGATLPFPATPNCAGVTPDQGNNVEFGGTSCPSTFLRANPTLAALGNNGGLTQTMALQPGSPAIHHVPTCVLSTDQRGVGRSVGAACDSGAYQFAPPSVTGVSGFGNTTTTALVSAAVNPNLKDTRIVVTYGRTTGYGSSTAPQDVGAGNSPASFAAGIAGLSPGTTYHFDVVATNGDGTTASGDRTFTTVPPVTASIASATTSGPTLSLTIACGGGSGPGACAGPIAITSHVTTQGGKTVAVTNRAKRKPKKPKRVTKVVTVGKGSYRVATGKRVTVKIKLNSTGQKLLSQRYMLPTTVSLAGTTVLSEKVTFKYPVIRSPISFTWTFSPTATVAQNLTVTGIPSGGKVTVICHGGGCPFGKRTFSQHHGRVALTSTLGHSNLRPGATLQLDITASNQVGKVAIFTMRSGQQPRLSEACLPPGAGRPSRCV